MLDRLKKSNSHKSLGSSGSSLIYNNKFNSNKINYNDTDSLCPSRYFITPSMIYINNQSNSNFKFNEKVIVKITNTYLEIIQKDNLDVIKTILLKDIKEFNFNEFWEIHYRNENRVFEILSFSVHKGNSLNSKVLEFLKHIKRDEEHNSEFIPNLVY